MMKKINKNLKMECELKGIGCPHEKDGFCELNKCIHNDNIGTEEESMKREAMFVKNIAEIKKKYVSCEKCKNPARELFISPGTIFWNGISVRCPYQKEPGIAHYNCKQYTE